MHVVKCLMCRTELRSDSSDAGRPLSTADAIDDGGTVEISFGYGSQLDCVMALGHICDHCFSTNKDLFTNYYNGLHDKKTMDDVKPIDKPKRRRK